MEAKEKAEELISKFERNVLDYEGYGLLKIQAEECALIFVNELLESFLIGLKDYQFEYWNQVKNEIIKIKERREL